MRRAFLLIVVATAACVVIAVGVALCIGGCEILPVATGPQVQDGMYLTLRAEQGKYGQQEPVILTCQIHNTREDDVVLYKFNPGGGPWMCDILTVECGVPPYKSRSYQLRGGSCIHLAPWPLEFPRTFRDEKEDDCLVRVSANGSVSKAFSLSQVMGGEQLPPGRYRILVDYIVEVPRVDDKTDFTNALNLHLVSNTVDILVTEPEK